VVVNTPDETPAARGDAAAGSESRAATPSVTAVVVAHDPGEWFSETLSSLAAQDYPRLDLLVVDASGDPGLTERLSSLAPDAGLVDASDAVGFAAAANAVLDTDVSSAMLLICHDDVAPEPDAVNKLVTESLRSNAGITGPKLVDWDDPDRLQHVGLIVDRFADAVDVVDPSEMDQQQYDNVADVFAVPSACMLVRRSLFEALGGFDPKMLQQGENVDLCWRAQLAGARVIVAPDAVVRHRRRISERPAGRRVRRVRSQLRTVLVNSSRPMLAVNLALMAVLSCGEALIALLTLRFDHIRELVDGWAWNLGSLGEIRKRRKLTHSAVEVKHRDVRALQALGSVRVNSVVRTQIERGQQRLGSELASVIRTGTTRFVLITWALVVLFVIFGSRALLSEGPTAVGDFAAFGESGRELLADWWGSWHDRDLGSPGALASGLAAAGAVASLVGVGLTRTLMVIGPVFVGLIGIWRLLSDTGSRRAQMAAILGYLLVPVAWASIASASNPGLIGYAVAPFVLRALLRAEAAPPCSASSRTTAHWLRAVLGTAVAAALGVMFAPESVLLLPVSAAGLLVGSVLSARPGGLHRLVGAAVLGAAAALLLVIPQTLDVGRALGGGTSPAEVWSAVSGGRTVFETVPGITDILRFDAGSHTASPLLWLLAPAVVLPLLVGRSWRFELAVRLWAVALGAWALVFADVRGWLPFSLGDPALLLAPAAAGVAGLCGLGVASVEHDLSRARFGLPQLMATIAVAGAVAAAVPIVALTESGRWDLPRAGFEAVVPFEDPAVSGSYRVLWIGHRDVLPAGGRNLGYGLAYAATLDRHAQIADREVAVDPGSAALLGGVIDNVISGETQRAGRLLGGLGVRYVVVLDRLAPAPFSSPDRAYPVPSALPDALGRQLDLRHLSGVNSAMEVYENTEWTSVRAAAAVGFDSTLRSFDGLEASPISGAVGVLFGRGDSLSGTVPVGTELFVAQTPDDSWTLEVDGSTAASRPAAGWATAYAVGDGSRAELTHATDPDHRLATILQLLAWVFVFGFGLRRLLGAGAPP